MLHNDPHNAIETTKSLNWFMLDFYSGGHNFSSSDHATFNIIFVSACRYAQDVVMVIGIRTWICIGHGNVSILLGVGCLFGDLHCCLQHLHLSTHSTYNNLSHANHIHHVVITLRLYLVHIGFIYECNVHSIWLVSAYISCTMSYKHSG